MTSAPHGRMNCPHCEADIDPSAESCIRCGRALYALTQGTLVGGRYEVLGFLGKGGMGMVYKALDRELDETVALKILRSDVAASPDIARRFRSEIKLARRVTHRNVCRIHEYGRDRHLSYIVMEFIDGTDLKRIIREQGPLPPKDAFDVSIRLAEALEVIHEAGIIHRDLKTTNVMRDRRGAIKLMDFGIAKSFDTQTTAATQTGHIVGTPEYMSPEQARAGDIDARSDLYALGVVVYELFTGEVPFRGDTPLATLMKHLSDSPPLEGLRAARIPSAMLPVLQKALAKTAAERFATAAQMGETIRSARNLSVSDVVPTPTPLPAVVASPAAASPVATPHPSRRATAPQPDSVAMTPIPTLVPTPVPTPVPTAISGAVAGEPAESIAPTAHRVEARPRTVASPNRATLLPRAALPAKRRVSPWVAATAAVALVAAGGVLTLRPRQDPPSAPVMARVNPPAVPAAPTEQPGAAPEHFPTAAASSPATRSERISEVSQSLQRDEELRSTPRAPVPAAPFRGAPATEAITAPANRGAAEKTNTSTLPASELPVPMTLRPSPLSPSAKIPGMSSERTIGNTGVLEIAVLPWAEVSVDGKSIGATPLKPFSLPAGPHIILLTNPGFRPLQKRVTVLPGESTKLEVDLSYEAFPK